MAAAALKLGLDTRSPAEVDNLHDPSPILLADIRVADSLRRSYPSALHRPTNVSYGYNCHGLTFAARRTQITSAAAVRRILLEDGYVRIAVESEVLAGDLIIYVSHLGDIEHSGIVMEIIAGIFLPTMKVLSKWGSAHEVVHALRDCPYASSQIEFYRLEK